ncbi:hypothetical protein J6590_030475 [Homalodisca vitripennis]|nr:hypothetical protein J6590_030475 [Homalodisca vitripennis]
MSTRSQRVRRSCVWHRRMARSESRSALYGSMTQPSMEQKLYLNVNSVTESPQVVCLAQTNGKVRVTLSTLRQHDSEPSAQQK